MTKALRSAKRAKMLAALLTNFPRMSIFNYKRGENMAKRINIIYNN